MSEKTGVPSHWDILIGQDPELNDKIQAFRSHINESDKLERKYKELMMVSMSCVIRFSSGIRVHGKLAIEHGATKDQLFAAICQSFFIGGIPAFKEGCLVFYEMFQ